MANYHVTYWAPTQYGMDIEAETEEEAIKEAKRLIEEEMYHGDNLGFNSDKTTTFQARER